MSLSQESIHSFIIKLWLAGEFEEKKGQEFSGYIIHIPSGEKRYVNNLKGIKTFIEEQLKTEDKSSRFTRWLKRRNWF